MTSGLTHAQHAVLWLPWTYDERLPEHHQLMRLGLLERVGGSTITTAEGKQVRALEPSA